MKAPARIGPIFLQALLVVIALVYAAWALSSVFGDAAERPTDWRGLIPLAMALAVPCALFAAAVFIPLSRRRYARRVRERAAAAQAALAARPKVPPSSAAPEDLRFARPADAGHPPWFHTGSTN